MAKVMSLVMIVFMVAPIVAPSIGQLLLFVTDWKGIFWALVVFGGLMFVWVLFRLPETLPVERRAPLNAPSILRNYWTVLTTREAVGYMAASGLLFASLMSYISSSEQLYHEVYDTGALFPLWFAGAAVAMAVSNLINSRFVERFGMRRMSHGAMLVFVATNGVHAFLASQGPVPFELFYTLVLIAFFAMGFQGPNYNAIAMEPLGRIAGSGAALIGFSTSFVAAMIGGLIAHQFDGTLAPIFIGNFAFAFLAVIIVLITERGKLFRSGTPD